jgi:hypothetical protein
MFAPKSMKGSQIHLELSTQEVTYSSGWKIIPGYPLGAFYSKEENLSIKDNIGTDICCPLLRGVLITGVKFNENC